MKNKILIAALSVVGVLSFLHSNAQVLVDYEQVGSESRMLLQAQGFFAGGAFDIKYGVDFYKVTYETPNVSGGIDTASGLVVFPTVEDCEEGLTLCAYEHGTVLRKENVPSRNNNEATLGKLMAGVGMVTVMPDYLGLGDAPGFHPYIHAESQATATIDAFRAARELSVILDVNLNDDVLITGYSQGGHAAMATHHYIQTEGLESEFNLLGSAPCSGPYDMSGVQSDPIVQGAAYDTPGYVVYLLNGYNTAYDNLFDSIHEVLQPQFHSTVPPLLDGNSSLDDLNAALPQEIDSFLTEAFMTDFRNAQSSGNHPLWENLKDNDLYDWTPTGNIRMYYCTEDEQVFYQNSLVAQDAFEQNGSTTTRAINRGAQGHAGCLVPALSAVAGYFDSLLVICGEPVIEDTTDVSVAELPQEGEQFSIYPNPATDYFRIDSEKASKVEVFDARGRMMLTLFNVAPHENVSIDAFPVGLYFVRISEGEHSAGLLKLVKK